MSRERSEPRERYPGERQGLGLFLEELQPVVAALLGTDSLLHHSIRKALGSGRLSALRHARGLFNSLPRDERQALQAGILAHHEPTAKATSAPDGLGERRPRAVVRIDCGRADSGPTERGPWGSRPAAPRIALGHEILDDVALSVLVRPGSLPSGVAARLREIADLLERDRRLLSARYWRAGRLEDATEPGDGPGNAERG